MPRPRPAFLKNISALAANKIIIVKDQPITVIKVNSQDFISLTDMIKAKDGDFFVADWLRNRNTLEYLGIWEAVNNPGFNYGEFAIIKSKAGLNTFKISVKEWSERTNAIGLKATAGRYGGTYGHKDIAFEFGMWISPEFKIYLIKEFQRLKDEENSSKKLDWNLQRTLSKINYRIHTDAIKEELLPPTLTKEQKNFIYASEAEVLNMALFGQTAATWRTTNKDKDGLSAEALAKAGNIRDHATLEQLVVLTNLESINAVLIRQALPQPERLQKLNEIAISQMRSLLNSTGMKKLK